MESEYGVYIVITQTGTALSQALKAITGDAYNHASISLRPDLARMFSFGRLHPYNPFAGGFVVETTRAGTFKRFANTDCIVLYKAITEDQHEAIAEHLRRMYREKHRFGYNHMGLVLAGVNIPHKSKHERYYCSEFVRDMLVRFGIEEASQFPDVVKPMDLLNVRDSHIIYRGKLRGYRHNLMREMLKKRQRPYLLR